MLCVCWAWKVVLMCTMGMCMNVFEGFYLEIIVKRENENKLKLFHQVALNRVLGQNYLWGNTVNMGGKIVNCSRVKRNIT